MNHRIKGIAGILLLVLVSCAIITVNVYFPEKEVKEAYKELEKELMTPESPSKEPTSKPEGKPEGSSKIEFISSAYAQERTLSERIAEIVRKMPDVVNAYKEIGARIPEIDKLRDSGAVGEGNNGMLVVREEKLMTPEATKLVALVNENRRTIIDGMSKAIIRINRAPENEQNLKQVMPQATEQFAAIRRDSAKKGCWIQDQYGNWTRK
jgi:uncharacterized protein YdbL (DUF1318 family)